MRIVEQHNCRRRHRGYPAFVRCVWPGAVVVGDGPLATVSTCGAPTIAPRVYLLPLNRLSAAQAWLHKLAEVACAAEPCTQDHELVGLDIDAPSPPPSAQVPADLQQRAAAA